MTANHERGVAYWKARAEALAAVNRRLNDRFLALAALLPPEYLDLVESEQIPGDPPRPSPPVMDPGEDGPHMTPADVESELRSLWKRTAPPKRA